LEKHLSSSFHKIANTISWVGIHSYSYLSMSIIYSGAHILPAYINYYIAIMSIQWLLKKFLKDKFDTNKIMVVTQKPTIMKSNKDILCNNNQNIIMQSSKIKIEGNNKKMVVTQEPTMLQFKWNTLQKHEFIKWNHAKLSQMSRIKRVNVIYIAWGYAIASVGRYVESWKCHSFPLHFHYYVHYITSISLLCHHIHPTFIIIGPHLCFSNLY